jgi:hypothetical protein
MSRMENVGFFAPDENLESKNVKKEKSYEGGWMNHNSYV